MVPRKLTLKNFMCYKNASLDLDGIHLACLSGDNGAGKSAILDAMTWALWGKARATSDEIVAQGELEMQADLEFLIGEQDYRIVRTHSRKSGIATQLSFQVRTLEGGWRNISDNTQRATQERIIDTIKMKYDTFINSAFLLQGKADEFTTKTAGERKKVLAEILGLNYYDELETKAKDESKEAEQRRRRLDDRLGEIEQELALRPQYQHQKRLAEEGLATSRAVLESGESELAELQRREDALKAKEETRQRLLRQLAADREKLADLSQKLRQVETTIAGCQAVIGRREQTEKGYKEYLQVEQEFEESSKKFVLYGNLIGRRREVENAIKHERNKLDLDKRALETSLRNAEEQRRKLPILEKEVADLQLEINAATQANAHLELKKAERQAKQTELEVANQEARRLQKLLREVEEKAKAVPQPGDKCDRCGTLIIEENRDHIVQEYRNEWQEVKQLSKEAKQNQDELKAGLDELEKEQQQLEAPARKLAGLLSKQGSTTQKLHDARQVGESVAQWQAQLDALNTTLETENYGHSEKAKQTEIEQQLKALAFHEAHFQNLDGRRVALKKYVEEKKGLDSAIERLANLREQAEFYEQQQTSLQQAATENLALAEALALEVADLNDITAQRGAAQQRKISAESQVESYKTQLREAELNLQRCDKLALEKKTKELERDRAAKEVSIYKELSEAFGKKGLQALIIDTVLPELEDEANRLLRGMSDGRMTVNFDTLRDSKKGEAIETLELKITDEQGPRPYELFSGGEAFRVNFAVRVALSKLLARRSGAALRTLVIDEGFGTQDGSGRERLVEAIRSIEDEFDRVLVITHIQELKDVFPVRIDVVKTANGSQITVN